MRWHDRSQPRTLGRSARRRAPGSTGRPSTGKVIEHDHNPDARQPVYPVGEDRDRRRPALQQGAGRGLTARRPILLQARRPSSRLEAASPRGYS
jgi:hypothetical protein